MPGRTSRRGDFVCCLIVVRFMGLGGTYGCGEILKSSFWGSNPQRVATIFYWGSWPLEAPSKDFHLAIGRGLVWMKCLKNGAEKGFIFHATYPALCPFC